MANKEVARHISIECSGEICGSESVQWALEHLRETLRDGGVIVNGEAAPPDAAIRAAGADSEASRQAVRRAGLEPPAEAEAFAIVRESKDGAANITAVGADTRGLVYALLELADRVRYGSDPLEALTGMPSVSAKPSMPIRSVTRLFVSEAEDKPWFYDKAFWDEYLTELAAQRFNRFSLALGIGYDSGHDPNVKDNYLCFAYPFFVDVPGYSVRAANLAEGEAERNLAALRYIGEQAKRRGLHFQLGLWTHSFAFPDSPDLRYPIEGVTPDNHAPYCRDALKELLKACPSIDGVTLRVHYESGIPEPASDFWRVVMQGAERDERRVEIDLHAKGVDDGMIDSALRSGSPVLVSAKYWAEHMGLPYHQADIRPMEKPRTGRTKLGFDAVTAAARRFTRYGYGDFLKENRKYGTLFRVWPGTQRLLLWGDPVMAAGYGRSGTFCGSQGVEWFEPLSFKARKNSGTPGGREPYADPALRLAGREWKKYRYTYRLWGRLSYNPEADPEEWRRYLNHLYGDGAPACEAALARASRILPLVTVAYHPSAANNVYWPEMYSNQGIVAEGEPSYSFDTPAPNTFGSASPLDPQLFYRVNDYADDLLRGQRSGKLGPPEVADRLDELADAARRHLAEAAERIGDAGRESPEFRRLSADVEIQIGLGRFFAKKLRAALFYALYERTGDSGRLLEAIRHYRKARAAWESATEAASVYKEDVAFGFKPYARGHWSDRVAGIDRDLSAMEREYERVRGANASSASSASEDGNQIAAALVPDARRTDLSCAHVPSPFFPGKPLKITADVPGAPEELRLRLIYRRANQADSFQVAEMTRSDGRFEADIPAAYTETVYPIAYYFEASDGSGNAWLYPGLTEDLSNQPYYVARLAAAGEERL